MTVGAGSDSTIEVEVNRFLDFEATSVPPSMETAAATLLFHAAGIFSTPSCVICANDVDVDDSAVDG